MTLECLLCLFGLEVPKSLLGGDDEINDTEETSKITSENSEKVTEIQNHENLTPQAEDGSHSQSETTVLLSNSSERTSPAPELTDLCTEHGCQQSAVICDIPTQDGNVIQNGCDKDVGQSVLTAKTNSDNMHTTLEHLAVLTAMSDSDNMHNASEHQAVLTAMSDSDNVHNGPEQQAVLTSMKDGDNLHNTSEKYSEENTPETSEYLRNSRNSNSLIKFSRDVQQVHEDGSSYLSGRVKNSESQTSPAKESMESKHSYSVVQIDGLSNCSSETHLSKAENFPLATNCVSNDLPLTSSETISLNMFKSCNTCSLLRYDSSNACSVDQIDIVLNERLQSSDLCNINENLNDSMTVIRLTFLTHHLH